jgi:cytochrome c-type biogenesis protein CcmH/NrfG
LNLVVKQMDKCSSLMPDDWRPKILCHEILILNDRHQEAEERMRQALKKDPDDYRYLRALAQSLEKQPEKKDEYVKLLKEIVALGSDPWNDHLSLARAYIETKEYDSAIKVIQQFANAHPGDRRAATFIQQIKQLADKPEDTAMKADTAKAVVN